MGGEVGDRSSRRACRAARDERCMEELENRRFAAPSRLVAARRYGGNACPVRGGASISPLGCGAWRRLRDGRREGGGAYLPLRLRGGAGEEAGSASLDLVADAGRDRAGLSLA